MKFCCNHFWIFPARNENDSIHGYHWLSCLKSFWQKTPWAQYMIVCYFLSIHSVVHRMVASETQRSLEAMIDYALFGQNSPSPVTMRISSSTWTKYQLHLLSIAKIGKIIGIKNNLQLKSLNQAICKVTLIALIIINTIVLKGKPNARIWSVNS